MMLRDVRGRDVSRVWKALGQRPRASVFAKMVSAAASTKFRPSCCFASDGGKAVANRHHRSLRYLYTTIYGYIFRRDIYIYTYTYIYIPRVFKLDGKDRKGCQHTYHVAGAS